MKYRYSTKEGIFETEYSNEFPWGKLHSLNDNPAWENLSDGYKAWYFEGKLHREIGPARIWSDEKCSFYLNGKYYKNINEWISNHPNIDIYLDAIEMNDLTERAIWKLQNL